MIGDKLVVTDFHREGAAKILAALRPLLDRGRPVAVTVAGESGCGKTETAHCLAELLGREDRSWAVLSQDDYFHLPPQSNHRRRLADIGHVGPGEVRLDLLDEHVAALKSQPDRPLTKPLVYFDEDRIGNEVLPAEQRHVIIVEGTYTTLLANADLRAFINLDYHQTKKARAKRARDPDSDFVERVLEIEHREISSHRVRADAIIDAPADPA